MAVEKTYLAEKGLQLEIKTGVDAIKVAVDAGTIGKTPRRQVFTANGNWTAPAGITRVLVTGGGAGGSGATYGGVAKNGVAGGVTSFSSILTLIGGAGGIADAIAVYGRGGVAGGPGGQSGGALRVNNGMVTEGGIGGNSGPFFGGPASTYPQVATFKNGGYCSGGGASCTNGGAGCGGGGDFVFDYPLTVNPGTSYPITIGLGGAGVNEGTYFSGNGGNGILIIEWWE